MPKFFGMMENIDKNFIIPFWIQKIMNDKSLMNVALIPFNLAALPLIPTDWVRSSSEVNLTTSLNTIAMVTTIRTGVGMGIPGIKLPIAEMMGLEIVGVAPPFIQ